MTTRLATITPEKATGPAKEMLGAVQTRLGRPAPNMMRTMASSPAVLKSYLDFSTALSGGKLDAKLRERLALAVSEKNGCVYCVDAHTVLGTKAGLSAGDVLEARKGKASDPRAAAALAFATKVAPGVPSVDETDVAALRKAGFDDAEIGELVANVALNQFTNLFNHVAGTERDFPAAPSLT